MKPFITTTIATDDQNVSIMPNETFNGIILETKELDDKTLYCRLYLNKEQAELLILQIQTMIKYLEL